MTLEKAIELLRFEYSWAEQQNWIMNPLAYALLQVWKAADKEGVKRMTERKRLIKLLNDGCYKACSDASGKKVNEVLADYLLANGVTVLPCKVGDAVYSIWEDDEGVLQIDEIEVHDVSVQKIWINGGYFGCNEIGVAVFLTREEAEKALKDRKQ